MSHSSVLHAPNPADPLTDHPADRTIPSGRPDTPLGAFEQSPPDGAFSTLARSV